MTAVTEAWVSEFSLCMPGLMTGNRDDDFWTPSSAASVGAGRERP